MSEKDNFLDFLSEIDEEIISEAVYVKQQKPRENIKKIITLSAAVLMFIISALIIKNGFFDTDYILPSESFSGISSDTPVGFTEKPSEKEFVTDAPSSEALNEPSENTSAHSEPSVPFSSENETSTEDGSQGTVGGEAAGILFNEVSYAELIYTNSDSIPEEYTSSEKTDIYTLEKIYGTKIIPSYLPVNNGNSLMSGANNSKYTVYYNEDKTEVFCNNSFTYLLNDGSILRITASTHPLKLSDIEEQYRNMISVMSDTPVLLFKGIDSEIVSVYSAFFQKDGCYFRIQMSGFLTDEEEFTKIIESLI